MGGGKEDGVDGGGVSVCFVGVWEGVKSSEEGVGEACVGGEGGSCVALCGGGMRCSGDVEVRAAYDGITSIMAFACKGGDGGGVGFCDGASGWMVRVVIEVCGDDDQRGPRVKDKAASREAAIGL